MWLYSLIILGTCVAGVVLGVFVYWIIIKIKKILRANPSNSRKRERQTPLTITEDIDDQYLEQPLNEADSAPDIQKETDTETEVPEVSSSAIEKEDDDWLNAGVEEIPTNVDKPQDDDWINAENKQPLETVDVQSLEDIIIVKPGEEPVNQSHPLMDEISIRPVENQVSESHIPMDEITVRPVESPVIVSPQLKLMDEISIRPVENQVSESHALMDEIFIKPSPGPVNIEYELLDDLITKKAIYRTKKAKPSSDAVITNPVENSVEKVEPVKTVRVNEITEILNEKRDLKQTTIPSTAVELRSTPSLARMGEGIRINPIKLVGIMITIIGIGLEVTAYVITGSMFLACTGLSIIILGLTIVILPNRRSQTFSDANRKK